MQLQPRNGHLVIDPYEKPEQTDGLLMVNNQTNSAPVRGTVTATGPDSEYNVGDELFFRKYAIDELTFTNENGVEETVFIIDEQEVLARISNGYASKQAKDEKRLEEWQLSQEKEVLNTDNKNENKDNN